MIETKPTISFEFFPAKTEAGLEKLKKDAAILSGLNPTYMTVTYGAGGSTQDKTFEIVEQMQELTGKPIASHLTYINKPKKEIYALADEIWDRGIHHLVALRGDMPEDLNWPLDPDEDYFQYTSHFVAALKARQDFEISVGAYPEKHPDAPSLDADIEALMKKCDAGADRAITQFFFDNKHYYEFLEACAKVGINKPIVPGILPIHDFEKMMGFAKMCNTTVPYEIQRRFIESPPEDHTKIAEEIFITQCRDLIENGVSHFHFYTLNKAEMLEHACRELGLNK
ncbi:MAG: methylenetetrahydrofolate reductase [NAD(P)H] [Micavibrio sp.]|nr:methylenetetrahydrofolate reductase [NAD(P)H] [Micavibrio sp.]